MPWLRNIPGLGYLFKGESKNRQLDELLIFITPHILKKRPTVTVAPRKPVEAAPAQ
ncbi:hypothetical protein [Desulfosarcina sp.]|uniref:hypothetical protein n=1 Tax=Desulfosarcina sp. TaxID=2027861 RepID=UPI0039B8DD1D